MEKLSEIWIKVFGPMKTLISDQEAGIKSENAGIILSRWGVQRVLLPKGRHEGIVLTSSFLTKSERCGNDGETVRDMAQSVWTAGVSLVSS
eukprot:3802016-Amphidinium_carterae.1